MNSTDGYYSASSYNGVAKDHIYWANLTDGAMMPLIERDLYYADGLEVATVGGAVRVYFADRVTRTIRRMDADGSNPMRIMTSTACPSGGFYSNFQIAIDDASHLYMAYYCAVDRVGFLNMYTDASAVDATTTMHVALDWIQQITDLDYTNVSTVLLPGTSATNQLGVDTVITCASGATNTNGLNYDGCEVGAAPTVCSILNGCQKHCPAACGAGYTPPVPTPVTRVSMPFTPQAFTPTLVGPVTPVTPPGVSNLLATGVPPATNIMNPTIVVQVSSQGLPGSSRPCTLPSGAPSSRLCRSSTLAPSFLGAALVLALLALLGY